MTPEFAEGGRIDGSVKWAESDDSGCFIPYTSRVRRSEEILAQIAVRFATQPKEPTCSPQLAE